MDAPVHEDGHVYAPLEMTPSWTSRRHKWSDIWHLIGFVGGIVGTTLFVAGVVKHWNAYYISFGLTFMLGGIIFLLCGRQLEKGKRTQIHNSKSPCSCFLSDHTISFEEKCDENRIESIGRVDI